MSGTVKNQVVAGGPDDFMTVRHLLVRGSPRDIGRALALEATERFPLAEVPLDPSLNRARRRWVQRTWPEHYDRMEGIADALGVDVLDDAVNVVDLAALPLRPGCSVLWCPPGCADDGHARLGRNFDFRTDSAFDVIGIPSEVAQPAMMSAPYLIETHPTEGLASVVISACDVTGCFEGINEAGVAVALLADDESTDLHPTLQYQAGLHESQVARFVLDQCRDVDDAIEALRCAKQYDNMFTCHYVVADRHGGAFVWERDSHNVEHVVRAGDAPMCVTNYLMHRYPSLESLPHDDPNRQGAYPFAANMYERARVLHRRAAGASLSAAAIETAMDEVAIPQETVGARTLWRTTFDLEARSLSATFYLGDAADGTARRSPPVTCTLAASVGSDAR
jgi:hypothetical protein